MGVLYLFVSVALAYESEPVEFVLEDTTTIWSDIEQDSGWLPDDGEIAVRFQLVVDGGASVIMDGESGLTWPDALTWSATGTPGTGLLMVDTTVAAVTSVKFEIYGYTWEEEIDRRDLAMDGEAQFEPFLLPGGIEQRVEVVVESDDTELLEVEYDVFTGVSLEFTADLSMSGTVGFQGVSWELPDGRADTADQTILLEPDGLPSQEVPATFVGAWDSSMDVVLTPTVAVCVAILGCVDLASFDIPVEVTEESYEQDFPELDQSYPLPVLDVAIDSYDFGEVSVGELVVLELPVGNLGELTLTGDVLIEGDDAFGVYPDQIVGLAGSEDGLVVQFMPMEAGSFEADLLLQTNDPGSPIYAIGLVGVGDGDGVVSGDGTKASYRGCGCVTSSDRSGPMASHWWLVWVLGISVCARRRGAGPSGADS